MTSPKKLWIERFRRETASTQYLPEIDGLRFVAIFWVVVVMHTTHFIDEKFFSNRLIESRYWNQFLIEGVHGVSLFFMISGFILSLPFAKQYLNNTGHTKPISLKRYYLRRLMRLEPPYLIALLLFFIAQVWILHMYGFNELLAHLVASAIYAHVWIYKSFPLVLPVAWSLEIEVQFYLIAPFLCLIFKIPFRYLRWAIFAAIIVPSFLYNHSWNFGNIFKFICFFALGMLMADFYCTRVRFNSNPALNFWTAALILCTFWFIPSFDSFWSYLIKWLLIVILFYSVLTNARLKSLFSNKYITVIGGMCYSIYLMHFAVLSLIGRLMLKFGFTTNNKLTTIPLIFFFTFFILLISGIYFVLVEKPFMKTSLLRNS